MIMPFANEHACRVLDPTQFVRFRRDNDSDPNRIIGIRKDGSSEIQSYRYPKDAWSVERARGHCRKHRGTFEPAMETKFKDDAPERRFSAQCELRLRDTDEEGKAPEFAGYAAVFNSLSESLLWGFRERLIPGAFSDVLKRGDDVRAMIEHKGGLEMLGRTTNETLFLEEDSKGLRARIIPPDTQAGRDAITLVGRGDLRHMSFGFMVDEDDERWDVTKGEEIRTIFRVSELRDVSIVADPAYTNTSVALRSLERWRSSLKPGSDAIRDKWKGIHLTHAREKIKL
jgi:HK97 family phage prohead protease